MKRPWQTELDVMRAEALTKIDRDVKNEGFLEGWDARPTGEDGYIALKPTAEKLARLDQTQTVRVLKGWHLILSSYEDTDGRRHWHFSAAIHPPGRESTVKDRTWLANMAEYLGAPDEALILPKEGERQVVENVAVRVPDRPIHYNWVEEPN